MGDKAGQVPYPLWRPAHTAEAALASHTKCRPSLPLPLAPHSLWQLCHSFIFVYFSCRGFCSISPKWDSYINKFHCITSVIEEQRPGLLAGASGPMHKALSLTHTPSAMVVWPLLPPSASPSPLPLTPVLTTNSILPQDPCSSLPAPHIHLPSPHHRS